MTFERQFEDAERLSEVDKIVLGAVRELGGQATAAQVERFEGVAEKLGRFYWATDILQSLNHRGLIKYNPESEIARLLVD